MPGPMSRGSSQLSSDLDSPLSRDLSFRAPAPPEGSPWAPGLALRGGVEGRGGGDVPCAFSDLLQQLEAEHTRQVGELRHEVSRLRRTADHAAFSGWAPGRGDSESAVSFGEREEEDEEAEVRALAVSPPVTLAPLGPQGGPTAAVAAWELDDDGEPPEPAEDFAPPEATDEDPEVKERRVSIEDVEEPASGPWLLKVVIVSASGLRRTDWGPGQSADPYCICSVPGKQSLRYRTPVIHATTSPAWRHECVIAGWSVGEPLEFLVNDHDRFSKDDHLGSATLPSDSFHPEGFDGELPLADGGPNATTAAIRISVQVTRQRPAFQMHSAWQKWNNPMVNAASLDSNHIESLTMGVDVIRSNTNRSLRRGSPCMLDPSSSLRLTWDVIGIVVLTIDLVWIPMQVFDPPEVLFVMVLQWWSVLFWTLDIILSFNTGAHSKEGHVVMSRLQVARLYARRWLLLDLLVVGMEWLVLTRLDEKSFVSGATSAARAGKVMRVVRLFRILRLMRLVKMRELIFALQGLIESEFTTVLVMVFINLMTILGLNHVLACMWFMVGSTSDDGWVAKGGLTDGDFLTNYLISMQWTMAQFTPGSSLVHPSTVAERFFSLGVLILGFVVATCFVSNITSTLSAVWSMKRNERTQSLLLKKFLRQNSISRSLASRVTRYIHCVRELRQRKVHPSHVQYLTFLSGPLHVELLCELRGPQICSHRFLKEYKAVSKYAFRELCTSALEQLSFARNDAVFVHSSEARFMYFISTGSTVYRQKLTDPANKYMPLPRVKLEAGQWCCEHALWMPWQHVGDMKALSDVDATRLNAAKFVEVTSVDPHVFHLARQHGERYVEEAEQVASFERSALSDLPWRIRIVGSEATMVGLDGAHHDASRVILDAAAREVQEAEDIQMEMIEFSDSDSDAGMRPSDKPSRKSSSKSRRLVPALSTTDLHHARSLLNFTQLLPTSLRGRLGSWSSSRTA